MKKRVDPDSPIPLYHQIAEAIRSAIDSGELVAGDSLAPLREAAAEWNVNLHTVRHAYASLVRDGLVTADRGRRGTRVVGRGRSGTSREFDRFVSRVADEAETRFGRGPADVAEALTRMSKAAARPRVWVVECSAWQCECHCAEIEARYAVEARPWTLDHDEPPPGPMIATYFHYNDIRKQWPQQLTETRFVTIYPDPALRDSLGKSQRVIVHELDESTIQAVVADLTATIGEVKIESHIVDDASRYRVRGGSGPLHLFAPRVWAELPDSTRDHPRALELRYVFDPAELEAVAKSLAWNEEAAA